MLPRQQLTQTDCWKVIRTRSQVALRTYFWYSLLSLRFFYRQQCACACCRWWFFFHSTKILIFTMFCVAYNKLSINYNSRWFWCVFYDSALVDNICVYYYHYYCCSWKNHNNHKFSLELSTKQKFVEFIIWFVEFIGNNYLWK